MKTLSRILFNPSLYSNSASFALLILRFGVGFFMLTHGISKVKMLFGDGPIQFGDPIGLGELTSLILASFAEFLCSIFLILGVASRFSALVLTINMLVIVLIVHAPDAISKKELPGLYAVIYMSILFFGAGKFSLDRLIYRKI